MTVEFYVQLTASFITIAASWLYGNKSPWGPWLGLASQVPWNIIMIHGGLWGLLPVNAMMLVVHTRNLIKWRREATTKWRADARRETLQAEAEHPTALQGDHPKRRTPKAYQILSGGELL